MSSWYRVPSAVPTVRILFPPEGVYREPAEFIVSGNKPSLRKAGCLASTALWTDSGARSVPPSSATPFYLVCCRCV